MEELRKLVSARCGDTAIIDGGRKPVHKLTLGELKQSILADPCWSSLAAYLVDRGVADRQLCDLMDLRNQVCHFLGDLTPAQRARLEEIRQWVARASIVG